MLADGVDPKTLGAKVGENGIHDLRYGGPFARRTEEAHRISSTSRGSRAATMRSA